MKIGRIDKIGNITRLIPNIVKDNNMKTLELTIREIKEIKLCDSFSKQYNMFFPVVWNPSENMSLRVKNIITQYQNDNESFNQAYYRILKAISGTKY